MIRTLRISGDHLQRFADASGDQNPLHTDGAFARATPYGRCIAQGALVTIAALAVADADALEHLDTLQIQFKEAVFPDADYTASLLDSDAEKLQIEVAREGRVAVAISCTADAAAPLQPVGEQRQTVLRGSPARLTVDELAAGSLSLDEPYVADLDALSVLAEELGASHVPESIMLWLAAASYTVGMVAPGENAVFVAARITRSSSQRSGVLAGSITTVDERTGLVILDVALDQREASARMMLQTFLRPPVPPPDQATIGRYLAPSTKLAARHLLVIGGSRGLGAALAGAFATQGATVWVGFAQSNAHVYDLRSEFGADRIRPLQFDASEPAEVRTAFATLRDETDGLDGIVLTAAPRLYESRPLHPDASESTLRFVHESIAMTLVPLAESLPLLSPNGFVVFLSSAALDDPPEMWLHYVVAKSAVEGAAAYCRKVTTARVLVVRAPTMWTDSTNTPIARLSAAPKEQVAAAIVHWAVTDSAEEVLAGVQLAETVAEPSRI